MYPYQPVVSSGRVSIPIGSSMPSASGACLPARTRVAPAEYGVTRRARFSNRAEVGTVGEHAITLGYGTYAMRELDIYEALPRLRAIGYRTVEIMGEEGWATAPAVLDRDGRTRLAGTIRDLGLNLSAVMAMMPFCEEGGSRRAVLEKFHAVCGLARDLCLDAGPAVVSSPLGGRQPPWDEGRERIAAGLVEFADVAREHGAVLAVEPHVGSALDSPEKAVWLMERTDHPALRLNFDISHFHVQGMELRRCVDLCLPHAVYVHVKDGYRDDRGKVVFQLPGEGSLDLRAYFRLLAERGAAVPVTAEVSAMIWKRRDYDPWAAAERSYAALAEARDGR